MARAKTRLAADIGFVHAQRLYKAMTAQVIRNVTDPRWDTVLAITPARWLGKIPAWSHVAQYPQTSGSLSPRLLQAFSQKRPTIVIGTDCPQVQRRDIAAGFKALRRAPVVFGPADDGGFWLMGLRETAPVDTFETVRWSTRHALSDVAKNLDCNPVYLRTLIDVDDLKALRAVQKLRQVQNRFSPAR